jgi:hypothetical protein
MAKVSGDLPKEKRMSEVAEMRQMIWDLFPPRIHDTKRSYFEYAARKLNWKARRVRAYFHDEVRSPTAHEWRELVETKILLQRSAQERRERLNDLAITIAQRDSAGAG